MPIKMVVTGNWIHMRYQPHDAIIKGENFKRNSAHYKWHNVIKMGNIW